MKNGDDFPSCMTSVQRVDPNNINLSLADNEPLPVL